MRRRATVPGRAAGEAVLLVGAHDRALEHAVADLAVAGEPRRVLGQAPVGVARVGGRYLLALDDQVALVHPVLPVGLEAVAAAEEQGEGEQRLHLDLGRLAPVGAEVRERRPGDGPGPGCEAELVLGTAQPLGLEARADREHPVGVLHDPLTGRALLDDGDHGMVVEAHRGVDPEEPERGVGHPDARVLGLADRPDAPGSVAGAPPPVRGEGDLAVADLQGARPAAHLGEAGGVERHPGELPVEVAGLEVGLAEPVVDGVEFDTPFVGLEDHPDLLEPLQDLDPDRPHRGVHPVGAQDLGGPHHPVVVTQLDRHEGVGHAQVRVLPDADHAEQLLVGAVDVAGAVDVEVVAVVEVPVRGADVAHRLGDLVDGVVVERGQHVGLLFSGLQPGVGALARADRAKRNPTGPAAGGPTGVRLPSEQAVL